MDVRENLVSILFALVVLGCGFWVAYAPWMAIDDLRHMARTGDSRELAPLIDRNALSTSLHGALGQELDAVIAESHSAAIGLFDNTMATAMLDPLVDMLLQPDGIGSLLKGQVPVPHQAVTTSAAYTTAGTYMDMNHFSFRITPDSTGGQPVELFLTREDALAWKLTDIRLPPRALISAQEVQTRAEQAAAEKRRREGITEFDGACVDLHVAAFHRAQGPKAEPAPELMQEWMQACSP